MSSRVQAAMVLSDGGVGSLLACWREALARPPGAAGAGEVLFATWHGAHTAGDAARQAARRQAQLSGLAFNGETTGPATPGDGGRPGEWPGAGPFSAATPTTAGGFPGEPADEADTSRLLRGTASTSALVAGARLAASRRIRRVVWPVHVAAPGATEPPLDDVADAIDRARLVGHLLLLDAPELDLVIETPFVDLTDQQMLELAVDLGAPRDAAWVCEDPGLASAASGCGRCTGCVRWRTFVDREAGHPHIVVPKRAGGATSRSTAGSSPTGR